MAETVAIALLDGTLHARFVETAVVINAYGPLMKKPAINCNVKFNACEMEENFSKINKLGIANMRKPIQINPLELVLSANKPAIIDPTIPPISNMIDSYADDDELK